MDVQLSPASLSLVQRLTGSGEYALIDEVIDAGLAQLRRRYDAHWEAVNQSLDDASSNFARGSYAEDDAAFYERLRDGVRARSAQMRATQ